MSKKLDFSQTKIVVPILVVLVFFSSNIWAATTGKIAGRVIDQSNGEPLPGANVVIVGTNIGAATDVEGRYFILNIPPGIYSVQSTMMGYKTVNQTEVRVKIGQTSVVDFELEETTIVGEAVTIVAERPVVEVDLTASKEVMSAEDIAQTWVNTTEEAVMVQSGVNPHGGVRGGFGLDMYYNVDGMELRDAGSNKSYVPLNTTSIQELEVLTGGFNAEYGSANSGIINVVTKMAKDKIHGNVKYEYRPAGVYHWGGNMYSKDRWEWQEKDQNGNWAPGSVQFWDPSLPGGHDGGQEPFTSMTPEQRLKAWQDIITRNPELTGYADRPQWELEGTFTGPITSKMDFMVSGRWKEGVLKFPNAHKYNPEWNAHVKLSYDFTENTKLMVSGMHFGTRNAGRYILPYQSGEDIQYGAGNPAAYFTSAYNPGKYWAFGSYGYGGGTGLGRVKPPEYIKTYAASAKLTHVFNPSTFLEVGFYHSQMKQEQSFFHVHQGIFMYDGSQAQLGLADQAMANGTFGQFYQPADNLVSNTSTRKHELKADFISQVSRAHQIKMGASFSSQFFFNKFDASTDVGGGTTQFTGIGPKNHAWPWEAGIYAQDKIEILGMVVNAGLRLDMFNANKMVNYTIWDPLAISDKTLGNRGIGLISFDPDGRYAEKTPTQVAISPRVGISHPITESTVLHFMYGHFNQRPSWRKIIGNGTAAYKDPRVRDWDDPSPWDYSSHPDNWFDTEVLPVVYDHNNARWNNPLLDYEKVIQYEIGFDQNIADLLGLDVTLYYKDCKDLTTLGTDMGGRNDEDFGTSSNPSVLIYSDPYKPVDQVQGETISDFTINTNGGTLESRGLELSLETRFLRNANVRLIYNMSYATSDKYGPATLYREFEDGTKKGIDSFHGGSNGDQGTHGSTNERWNPNHNLKLNAVANSPKDFGPALGSFYPLGDWTVNWYTQWASGRLYTYHAPDDFSTEPNNMRWEPKMFTNVRLGKMIDVLGMRAELYARVLNLFDQKQLRLLGGEELRRYEEEGILPYHPATGEDFVWDWYDLTLLPREVLFGIGIEF